MKIRIALPVLLILLFCSSLMNQQIPKGSDKKDSIVSIYSIKIDSLGGKSKIDLANYKGKKILIVNTATLDPNFSQIIELDKLRKDKNNEIVIILVPCSDFNSEPASDTQIGLFLQKCKFSFITAAKTKVSGKNISQLYQWLTQKALNGVADSEVKQAFQKYLIDEKGNLNNSFSASQRPLRDKDFLVAISKSKE